MLDCNLHARHALLARPRMQECLRDAIFCWSVNYMHMLAQLKSRVYSKALENGKAIFILIVLV